MNFNPTQIMNLIGQLGGNHQQAAQQMQGMGQIDPQQHSGLLSRFGIDPQRLQNGGYQQHFNYQRNPGFQGYQPDYDAGQQQPNFDQQQDYGQQQDYDGGGQRDFDGGGQDYDGGGGGDNDGGGQDFGGGGDG